MRPLLGDVAGVEAGVILGVEEVEEILEELGIMTDGFLHLDEGIRRPLEGGEDGEIVEAGEQGLAAGVLVLARPLSRALVPVLELRREGEDSTKLNVVSMCVQLLLYASMFIQEQV